MKKVYLDGKCVGSIEGRTFTRYARCSHLLRYPEPSWALAETIFAGEILPRCDTIVIHSPETGKAYQVSVRDFERHSFRLQRGNFEPQMALPLRYWQVVESETDQEAHEEQRTTESSSQRSVMRSKAPSEFHPWRRAGLVKSGRFGSMR